jgi:hypothetical protein
LDSDEGCSVVADYFADRRVQALETLRRELVENAPRKEKSPRTSAAVGAIRARGDRRCYRPCGGAMSSSGLDRLLKRQGSAAGIVCVHCQGKGVEPQHYDDARG